MLPPVAPPEPTAPPVDSLPPVELPPRVPVAPPVIPPCALSEVPPCAAPPVAAECPPIDSTPPIPIPPEALEVPPVRLPAPAAELPVFISEVEEHPTIPRAIRQPVETNRMESSNTGKRSDKAKNRPIPRTFSEAPARPTNKTGSLEQCRRTPTSVRKRVMLRPHRRAVSPSLDIFGVVPARKRSVSKPTTIATRISSDAKTDCQRLASASGYAR